MKYFGLLLVVISSLLFSACEEDVIIIPDLKAGKHRVLVEELTGVQCSNCPGGARELTALQKQYGKENLIVISMHAAQGVLSTPYSDAPANQYDFRSPEITEYSKFIGTAQAVPTASVNRLIPQGALHPYLNSPWSGPIGLSFTKDYGIGMFLTNIYDETTRKLDIKINIAPEQTLSGENRLSVVITQDSIVDVQLDGPTRIPDYIHRHVLRDVVSATNGDLISEPLTGGAPTISKTYSVTLPANYVAKHCSVVAFVHHGTSTDREVFQAVEAEVIK